jgi:ubiquinone/menaquinone biosynthesis C-methylase UbiE
MAGTGIRQEAQTGFAAASAYDTYRPTFPPEAVEELLKNLEVANVEGAKIADLAAGTGKFTELLSARPEKFEIVAIEPHDEMRAQLDRKKLQGVTVVKSCAEDLSKLEDGKFAALVAAQVGRAASEQTVTDEVL